MSGWRHSALAWGLLFAIVAAFASGLWLPSIDKLNENRNRLADLENRITKLELLARTRDDLKARIEAANHPEAGDEASQYVAAKSPALGTAELQRYLQDTIVANDAKQISSQAFPATMTNAFQKLVVSVNISGTLRSLQGILRKLEYGQPRIFVEQVLISANAAALPSTLRRRRNDVQNSNPELSARLLVAAYMHLDQNPDGDTTN